VTSTVTNFFIFGSAYILNAYVLLPWLNTYWGMFHSVAVTSLLFLGAISQWQAMLTDPGAVPRDAIPFSKDFRTHNVPVRTCRRCGCFKPARAHHDRISNRCVVKMDHYCPWVNNVVGFNNHKFFILFLAYIFLGSVYALGLIVWHHVTCKFKCVVVGAFGSILMMLVALEALLFGLFTIGMFCEQIYGVMSGGTQIDRLKGDCQEIQWASPEAFAGVFGDGGFSLLWLLPVEPQWDDHDRMLGFRTSDQRFLEV